MTQVLETYSLSQLLFIIITLALGIKGFITFWDWGIERLRKYFNRETAQEKQQEQIREHFKENDEKIGELDSQLKEVKNNISAMLEKMDLLIDSDKDDIKAWITEKHHYFLKEKWIDDYSLDCIEKRYEHYVNENGNSYVKDLMTEIRRLPKQPPTLGEIKR